MIKKSVVDVLTSVTYLYCAIPNSFLVFDFSEHVKKEEQNQICLNHLKVWVGLFPLDKKLNRRKGWS